MNFSSPGETGVALQHLKNITISGYTDTTAVYLYVFATLLFSGTLRAEPDPDFHCYLLFGQSNMAGGGAGVPIGGNGAGTLWETTFVL
jgi:hypothetical protein